MAEESLREVEKRNVDALFELINRYEGKNLVIGSHGTALCTVIHYFDSRFGYEDFCRVKNLFPWIVKFTFAGDKAAGMEFVDVFEL